MHVLMFLVRRVHPTHLELVPFARNLPKHQPIFLEKKAAVTVLAEASQLAKIRQPFLSHVKKRLKGVDYHLAIVERKKCSQTKQTVVTGVTTERVSRDGE